MDSLTPQPGGLIAATPYRSGRTRAQIAVFLLVASIVTALLSPLVSYIQVWLPDAFPAGAEADAPASADDASGLLIGLLFIGAGLSIIAVYAATVVAFVMWIHRAYSNLTALGNPKEGLEYSPGWAIGGFFIPFVNLVVPYRVVREIWVKSDPVIRSEQDWMFSSSPEAPGLIKLWWAFWLLSNFANNILFRIAGEAETPEALLWEGHLSAGVAVLEIIAAVLAIRVVRGIDRRQEERSRHVTFAYAVPPPPTPPTPWPTPGTQS
jgi:hypothetical protein